jgi:hypothetical protein
MSVILKYYKLNKLQEWYYTHILYIYVREKHRFRIRYKFYELVRQSSIDDQITYTIVDAKYMILCIDKFSRKLHKMGQ